MPRPAPEDVPARSAVIKVATDGGHFLVCLCFRTPAEAQCSKAMHCEARLVRSFVRWAPLCLEMFEVFPVNFLQVNTVCSSIIKRL